MKVVLTVEINDKARRSLCRDMGFPGVVASRGSVAARVFELLNQSFEEVDGAEVAVVWANREYR